MKPAALILTFVLGLVIESGLAAQKSDSRSLKDWADSIKITGAIQGEFRWLRDDPGRLAPARSSSDLYVRRVELGIETSIATWVRTSIVLNSEWLGDYRQPGEAPVKAGELHLDLQKPGGHGYLSFGLGTLPFGLFENHLISDPWSQNAYAVNKVAATLGLRGPRELDVSISVYKGPEQMTHLFQSGLFDTNLVVPFTGVPSGVSSWIGALSAAPIDSTLAIFGAVCSEPGTTRRDVTVNGGFSFQAPFKRGLSLDFEMNQALQRDLYKRASIEHDESVVAITVGYSFRHQWTAFQNQALYQARRTFLRAHPTELSVRYEHFNDDGLTADLHAWSLGNRLSAGGRYTLAESNSAMAYFAVELNVTSPPSFQPATPDDCERPQLWRLGSARDTILNRFPSSGSIQTILSNYPRIVRLENRTRLIFIVVYYFHFSSDTVSITLSSGAL